PEAETEIAAGSLTEYGGRNLALFHLSTMVELVAGLTLLATLYLGGFGSGVLAPLLFISKTVLLLLALALLRAAATRLRIDQVAGVWWRYGALLALGQWLTLVVVL
ncbi:MAG: NADH-quinone oxidoreductase subunit H, partial [Candidatus Promineifilaceae bacterium]|nr:NADH-quinone oxidoreductase subunit H [Candidatus Promineifilaceae bacterium]